MTHLGQDALAAPLKHLYALHDSFNCDICDKHTKFCSFLFLYLRPPALFACVTGIFTAPVNGLYYFTFSTYGYNTHTVGAILKKNNVHQISTYDSPTSDGSDFSSNAAVLQLAAGDRVHLELWDNGRVYDNLNGHTTFSGFLLFTLKK